jgi:hypothetical protein
VKIASGIPVDRHCSSLGNCAFSSRRLYQRPAEALLPQKSCAVLVLKAFVGPHLSRNRGKTWLNPWRTRPECGAGEAFANVGADINQSLTIPSDC